VPYGAYVEGPAHPEILREYGLEPDSYFLVASRLEPENNADITVEAFSRTTIDKTLVIVGGANYKSTFVERLMKRANSRITFLGPVYKPGHIRELHCGAFAYVHGNEVGGTNPALLKALGYGNCVLALDVAFNAEVVGDAALLYSRDPDDLAAKMRRLVAEPDLVAQLRKKAQERIAQNYQWDFVVEAYERILQRAAEGGYGAMVQADVVYPAR
jgi:glycosyltransferase involved in cell wall biosynthesis